MWRKVSHNAGSGERKNSSSHKGGHHAETLVAALRSLADALERDPEPLLGAAADAMAEDFMRSRAPPFLAHVAPSVSADLGFRV